MERHTVEYRAGGPTDTSAEQQGGQRGQEWPNGEAAQCATGGTRLARNTSTFPRRSNAPMSVVRSPIRSLNSGAMWEPSAAPSNRKALPSTGAVATKIA